MKGMGEEDGGDRLRGSGGKEGRGSERRADEMRGEGVEGQGGRKGKSGRAG